MRSLSEHFRQPPVPHSGFVSISKKGGVLIVRPTGPSLSEREATIIAREVKPVVDDIGGGLRRLLLDLSDIHVMSSFGLGLCIELRNTARSMNATTVIYGLTEELAGLFKMLKVDRLYTMAHSPKELARALAA